MGDHLTAGRDIYISFLEQAAEMAGLDFSEAVKRFRASIFMIPDIADSMEKSDLISASASFDKVAKIEKEAFTILNQCVS